MPAVKGLRQRLQDGESIVCAEGYHRELEKRGYEHIGINSPDVILQNPGVLKLLHQDLVHNGSDVVQAYSIYNEGMDSKSRGQEKNEEIYNRAALKIAREVALETGTLMAGSVRALHLYDPKDARTVERTKAIFKKHIQWAVQEGADFIIGESFTDLGEAEIALETIHQHGSGLPAVITLTIHSPERTTDDIPVPEALKRLEDLGADVVGLNCARGPSTMLPLLKEIRNVCKGPIAALPVPFRTSDKEKTWMSLQDPLTGKNVYPLDVDISLCNRKDIQAFAEDAKSVGVQYIGLCCGAIPSYIRELAQTYRKNPTSSAFGPNIKQTIMHTPNLTPYKKKKRQYQLGTWKGEVSSS